MPLDDAISDQSDTLLDRFVQTFSAIERPGRGILLFPQFPVENGLCSKFALKLETL